MKKSKHSIVFWILIALFIISRVVGLSLPYHQDEWKIARAAEIGAQSASNLYHPPFTQLYFLLDEYVFGGSHMRVLPFLVSLASAFLLYTIIKKRGGERAGLFALFLYTISFYSVLGSLMIDTDGALLPFFFLAALYCYDRWKITGFVIALLCGLLVKLSFILVLGVFIADYCVERYKHFSGKDLTKISAGAVLVLFLGIALMLIIKILYPAFRIDAMIDHAKTFAHLSGRNYLQIVVQAVKALQYLSPLLLLPLIFLTRDILKKYRIFFLYLLLALIFYFILFDFSTGALDKYLLVFVIPLSAICGAIIASKSEQWRSGKWIYIVGAVITAALLLLPFLPHTILSLYPKTQWFTRVMQWQWAMLVPFTGGSGPLGFYVSFLFIAVSFITSGIGALLGRFRLISAASSLAVLVIVGVVYNAVFAEEFLFGKLYGSSAAVLEESLAWIRKNPNIAQVVTYNDIGAYELTHMGKYADRFYAAPAYESVHRERFKNYRGHILVVNIPRLYSPSYYEELLAQCRSVFETTSEQVQATVYNCDT